MLSSTISTAVDDFLACPVCKQGFRIDADKLVCTGCAREYSVTPQGNAFLLQGPLPTDSALEIIQPSDEKRGLRYRVDEFYLPLLKNISEALGKRPGEIRVLDNGCGTGGAVEGIFSAGYDCWGVDPGARHQLWSDLDCSEHLLIADGSDLPFEDASFDLVFSFGVIEHVGLDGDHSLSRKLGPDGHERRKAFIAESIRVLKPGGSFVFAHPNGAFPVDFWHGGWKSFRPHVPYEGFLPAMRNVKRYCREIDPSLTIEPISPRQHLSFERISCYWYGRVFKGAMSMLISLMEVPGFGGLKGSPVNPFLVSIISRPA